MSKHTPGPWLTDGDEIPSNYSRSALSVWLRRISPEMNHSARWREYLANERLAAAAPTMLALLIESQTNIGGDWRDRRDAVIALATKETP